ncbi:hypothetical protein HanXRQr2_Chr06g0240281 [Helianthus annuus]|uniref:Uncharacterized protein n=1 Tax=Helianthus annuus TaxID=4232 RepID=A0A251UHX1_HELAN|nr:hypothetical protein HanXRQr2_Chr06g0240281 [Helianthus annuus]KAJ0559137.1 hypothetical protein HanHA300_Chr06g0197021 [Helianthus annuus]KAJ0565047.1 hypothetical protein HanIR_Chr06g0258271 [Helianthus annuus]KAJ0572082.1 hypothetical protein HanHA89_Chr06g0211881 [Helianthus annuus]KAJ0736543.1 hypothetical protein HanLR1_Chr06g0197101 [Helianthus annuus]
MALLWKKSKSVLRLCDSSSSSVNSTTRRFLVSIVGKTEDERKALFEADNIRYGRSFKTVEEKEKVFRFWKVIRLIEHPDPNDKLAFRNLHGRVDRD